MSKFGLFSKIVSFIVTNKVKCIVIGCVAAVAIGGTAAGVVIATKHEHAPGTAVSENTVPATCTERGKYDEVVYCSDCGEELSRISKELEIKPHTPSDYIIDKEASCKAEGLKHTECVTCKVTLQTVVVDKLSTHTPVTDQRVEPTVDKTGLTAGEHCSVCNAILVEQEVIPKLPKIVTVTSDTLAVSGANITGTFNNSTVSFDFSDAITTSYSAPWVISYDAEGEEIIANKVVALAEGNNSFYVHVTCPDDTVAVYTVNIYRNHKYTVIFDTAGGTAVDYVVVEEGKNVSAPNTECEGYTLSGWSYDFTSPIMKNEIILALWTPNTYTVTYDANGGSVENTKAEIAFGSVYTLDVPTLRGYSFLGWYYSDEPISGNKWNIAQDITVVAKWSVASYSIDYDLGGGTLAAPNPTEYQINSEEITLINPTREGYKFLGWIGTDISEATENVTVASGSVGNRSYVACWEADSYVITLDTKGGTESYDDMTVIFGDEAELPEPTKRGYTFLGWFDGEDEYSSGKWLTARNVDLVAKWQINEYNIEYTLDGGEVDGENPESYTVLDTVTLINPTKTGYTFLGWTYGEVSEPVENVSLTDMTGDISFVANWSAKSYTLSFDVDGGAALDSVTIEYGANFELPDTTKRGYTFLGWTYGEYDFKGGIWTYDRNVEVSAEWQINEYNIEYTLDGGEVDGENPKSYTVLDTVTLINPTKTGYTFLGWTYGEVSEPVENVSLTDMTGDISFVANWSANKYKITLNLNGGSLENNQISVTYGESFKLPTPTFEGHSFSGWQYKGAILNEGIYTYLNDATFIAKWDIETYEIKYDLAGGSVIGNNPESYTVDCDFTLINPEKTGYTFLGWTYNGVTEPTPYVRITEKTGNLKFVANWQINSYELSFNSMGGSAVDSVTLNYGDDYVLPKPKKLGYNFDGWFVAGEKLNDGVWNFTENVEVTAKWSVVTYSVNYNLNGGTVAGTNPTGYTVEQKFTLANPTKTGYTFLGWTYGNVTTPVLNVEIKDSTGNITFVANWELNSYTLSFNSLGGDSVEDKTVKYGSEYELPEIERVGYTFLGWFIGDDEFEGGIWTYTEDIEVSAKWDVNEYNIEYTLGGGTVAGTNPTGYTVDDEFTLANPTKTGYTFLGWTYGNVTTPVLNVEIKDSTGDICFVANWKANTYKLTLNADGGSIDPIEITVTYDGEFELPKPTRTGYLFVEWIYDGDTPMTDGIWTIASNAEFVATWSIITYNISYNLDGGVNEPSNPESYTVESGAEIKNPAKEGYTFIGWTYGNVTEPEKYPKIPLGAIGDYTFTANWTPNSYKLTFDAMGGEVDTESKNITYNTTYTVPVSTRTGYKFDGWYDGETLYKGGLWKVASDVTVVAVWTPMTYTLTYDTVGGTLEEVSETVTFDAYHTYKIPSRVGYTFLGWFVGDDEVDDGNWTVADNMIVTAKWQAKTYTVTYVGNEGTPSAPNAVATFDSKFTLATASREGYTFVGWYDGEQLYVSGIWRIDSDITLVAKWQANTNTKYIVNHYLQNIENDEYTLDLSENLKGTSDSEVIPEVNSYVGFTSPVKQSAIVKTDGSLVINYYYTRNYYTVTLMPNGGTGTEITQKYGSVLNTGLWTTRDGYTFGGWFNDVSLGDAYTRVTMPAENETVYAWWREEYKPSEFTYESVVDGVRIKSYTGTSIKLNIPAYIGNSPVTELASRAFTASTQLQEITLPNTLKNIGSNAFSGCASISKINSETTGEMLLPANVTTIGEYAFQNLELMTKVVVPDTVTSIGLGAFMGCNAIEDITLPFVGKSADATYYDAVFGYIFGCTTTTAKNTSYGISSTSSKAYINNQYSTVDGAVWQYACLTNYYSSYYHNTSYFYYIPTTIKNVTITVQTAIPTAAFNNCDFIETITIPATVTSIGDYAFQNCSALKRLNSETDGVFNIPTGVTEIKQNTFKNCDEMTKVTILANVTSIGNYAFNSCAKLADVEFATGCKLETIGSYAFADCVSIPEIQLPTTVTSIGNYAFSGCISIAKINSNTDGEMLLPENLITIGEYAFQNLELMTKVVVPDTATSIGSNAFKGCASVETITIPFVGNNAESTSRFNVIFGTVPETLTSITISTDTTIPSYAFSDLSYVESITIPTTVTSIGEYAFQNCSVLKRLNSDTDGEFNIPSGVTEIKKYTFKNCDEMTKVTIPANVTSIGNYAFNSCEKLGDVEFATGCKLETIESYAFADCVSIPELQLPTTVTSIGNYAFSGCTSIAKINSETTGEMLLPGNVTTIGQHAFQNLKLITGIFVPNSVTSINTNAFKGCNAVEEITLPFVGNNVDSSDTFKYIFETVPETLTSITISTDTTIPSYAFSDLSYVESITIPATVTSIGEFAFQNCSALKRLNSTTDGEFNIPDGVTEIKQNTFRNCKELVSVTIPDGVIAIGASAFNSCAKLGELKLPEGLITIGNSAFSGCTSVTRVNSETDGELIIPATVITIGQNAFQNLELITKVVVPNNVNTIGSSVFKGCNAIEDITIPFLGNKADASGNSAIFKYIFETVPSSIRKVTVTRGNIASSQGNYYYYKDHTYMVISQNMTWEQARAACEALGGHLVTVSDSAEWGFVSSIASTSMWLGGTDRNGSWQWITDEPWSFMVWESGEPTGGSEHFLATGLNDARKWNDLSGSEVHYFICEWDEVVDTADRVIPAHAFLDCKYITDIIYDGVNVVSVGDSAFGNCSSLGGIKLSENLKTLGSSVFYNCTSLKTFNSDVAGEINIPNGVTVIPSGAFYNCTFITTVNLGSNVTVISTSAFKNCISITKFNSETAGELIIPSGVTEIGNNAFENLSNIKKVVVPESVTIINSSAFKGCSAIEEMVLPFVGCKVGDGAQYAVFGAIFGSGTGGSVNSYSNIWYYIPTSIKTVTVTSQTKIPGYAFKNCSFLEVINLPAGATFGIDAMLNCSATVNYISM